MEAKVPKKNFNEEEIPGHGQSAQTVVKAERTAQRLNSPEILTSRQNENSGRNENGVGTINPGRAHAPGPPSQKHPVPDPPPWLSQALVKLQQTTYPDDIFKATMRYTAVNASSDQPHPLAPNEDVPPGTKFMHYPGIKCRDCPKKVYTPGPGHTLENFEVHLKNRIHREKVERRRKQVLSDIERGESGRQLEKNAE